MKCREVRDELFANVRAKVRENKERNSRISFALLFHNTVLHNRMFELIIHAKAKACVFPYKFCNYFTGRGFANHANS